MPFQVKESAGRPLVFMFAPPNGDGTARLCGAVIKLSRQKKKGACSVLWRNSVGVKAEAARGHEAVGKTGQGEISLPGSIG